LPPVGVASPDLDDADLRSQVQQHRGSRRELAVKLGLSERTLYRRLGALGLKGVTGDD
jgi:DNA-binding NtrC family response regulator